MDSYYNENYKGYEINIVIDDCPPNPFIDFDGEPPIAYTSDRSIETFGEDIDTVPYFDRSEFFRALPTILEITSKSSIYDLVRTVRQHSTDILAGIHWELTDAVDNLNDSDRLEALCDLYNAIGIPAVCKAVRGYSQGDYAEVLAVATPEFQETCGNVADWHKTLEGSIKLFQDWAFGNVWGYEVTAPDGETESCRGFYGDYDDVALPEARSMVDVMIQHDRKDHIERLKAWIKNHVPLSHRSAMV